MTEAVQPLFNIEKIYVKDASIEVPNAPEVFLDPTQPQVEIGLHSEASGLGDGVFNVVVTATVTAKAGDKTLFLVEVAQAGIFVIRGVPDQEIEPVLAIACPNILFPYARETVSDMVVRAGFPPVLLAPVNFEAIYQDSLQRRAQAPVEVPIQ